MTQQEEWRPIPGFSGYEVSNLGRVLSHRSGKPRILRPAPHPSGYAQVSFRIPGSGGARRTHTVHSLLALAFLGPRPEGHVVRHLDGDASNSVLSNLVHGSPSENMYDTVRHGSHWGARKTRCLRGHPFNEANTSWSNGTQRTCRICHNESNRRSRIRKAQAAANIKSTGEAA